MTSNDGRNWVAVGLCVASLAGTAILYRRATLTALESLNWLLMVWWMIDLWLSGKLALLRRSFPEFLDAFRNGKSERSWMERFLSGSATVFVISIIVAWYQGW
jgi:hypothetical protein